jgi:hypothetical protein
MENVRNQMGWKLGYLGLTIDGEGWIIGAKALFV